MVVPLKINHSESSLNFSQPITEFQESSIKKITINLYFENRFENSSKETESSTFEKLIFRLIPETNHFVNAFNLFYHK